MNSNALFKIGYGLYILSANNDGLDNGCIVNTVIQLTNTPNRIAVTVNKQNKTHDMIKESGKFNVSCLTVDTPFSVIKNFGFQSGRTENKFLTEHASRSENEILYLMSNSNAYLSGAVTSEVDLDTHTMFIADLSAAEILSGADSLTYAYYFANIKPKPTSAAVKKVSYRCQICGYVYEGDPLPSDFICPICKHGASDFEKI